MWNVVETSENINPVYADVSQQIIETKSRALIYTTLIICLLWYLTANVTDLWIVVPQITLVVMVVAASSLLANRLIANHLQTAYFTWLFGIFCGITLAIYLLQLPEIAYLYFLLPIFAVVTIGWSGAIALQAIILLTVWLAPDQWMIPNLKNPVTMMFTISSSAMLVIIWSLSDSLLTLNEWSVTNYQRADQELQTLRAQRLEFLNTQADLVLANKELARLTERLAAMQQVAEEARRIKEEFVANVSHELRTPLNMIIGFSDTIMNSPHVYGRDIPDTLLADIAAIYRNSQHLAKLVDDVLDLSQIEARRMAITKEWTSITEIIYEATEAVRALFDSKELYLKTEITADIPPIFCDSTRIRQVIINLLGNAGRFTDQGGVLIKVWLDGEETIISVTDTGPGISLDDQKNIFQPFHQIESIYRNHRGGSGLGLTISKQFVEMHDGRMWLESELGTGTTFFFSLPVQLNLQFAEGPQDNARRYFNPYEQYEPRLRTANLPEEEILNRFVLYEDDVILERLLRRYLDRAEVVAKNDFSEAVQELYRSPAQALILNPTTKREQEKIEEELSTIPMDTPVISCWIPGREKVAQELGVVEYLLKPVGQQEILNAIKRLDIDVKRILLVDDSTEILQLFTRMLSSTDDNYRILQASNGKRALNLMRKRQPDVVLLDLIMPDLDGFQLLREKSLDDTIRDIPVMVISSINPIGDAIVSDEIRVTRRDGLSLNDLINCIQTLGSVLSPSTEPVRPASPEKPGG
ncbi:MAG: response regulator [Anaerolineales bacterium]|nr:response regulator [Anaerolineales bacterium]